MKAITISADSEMAIIDVPHNGTPLYEQMHEAVGGYYENVYPRRLPSKYVMIVNEEGLSLGLPYNPIASYLYEQDKHGSTIVGNVIILKMGYYNCEPDVVGLTDTEVEEIKKLLSKFIVMKES